MSTINLVHLEDMHEMQIIATVLIMNRLLSSAENDIAVSFDVT